jgi:pyruvate dehydrogenase E2 component (dihydrolipoamide acetyltransferase)
MAQIIEMPKLSDTMKEGVLRKWRKNEGETIAPGDVVAEVETDKATMDFESFDEGVLLKRLVADGATVPVGAPIAIYGARGEDIAAMVTEAGNRSAGGKPAGNGTNRPAPVAAKPAPAPLPADVAPAARPVPAARPAPARPAPAVATNGHEAGRILASPLARRLADDLGVNLRSVQGTGPGGRIIERDIKAAAEAPPAPAPMANVPRADASLPSPILPERRAEARPAATAPAEDQVQPLSLMRKTIARRLLESKTTIPHFYLTATADMDAAMGFRQQVSEVHGAKLSVNDLIIKAVALALRRVPEANASWSDEGIVRHARVDISMAVAIEDGLLTPVLRGADVKTLGQIAQEARALAEQARTRKLRPEDMTGGTFSISNLGMMGIDDFCAIINPPEAGILAVGRVRKEPVVKDDKIVIGQRMSLTVSCDHRVIDGAVGAKLLQTIVSILERPMTLAF